MFPIFSSSSGGNSRSKTSSHKRARVFEFRAFLVASAPLGSGCSVWTANILTGALSIERVLVNWLHSVVSDTVGDKGGGLQSSVLSSIPNPISFATSPNGILLSLDPPVYDDSCVGRMIFSSLFGGRDCPRLLGVGFWSAVSSSASTVVWAGSLSRHLIPQASRYLLCSTADCLSLESRFRLRGIPVDGSKIDGESTEAPLLLSWAGSRLHWAFVSKNSQVYLNFK